MPEDDKQRRSAEWAGESAPAGESGTPTREDELGDELSRFVSWAEDRSEGEDWRVEVARELLTWGIRTTRELDEVKRVFDQWESAEGGNFGGNVWPAIEALRKLTSHDMASVSLLDVVAEDLRQSPTGREAWLGDRAALDDEEQS